MAGGTGYPVSAFQLLKCHWGIGGLVTLMFLGYSCCAARARHGAGRLLHLADSPDAPLSLCRALLRAPGPAQISEMLNPQCGLSPTLQPGAWDPPMLNENQKTH